MDISSNLYDFIHLQQNSCQILAFCRMVPEWYVHMKSPFFWTIGSNLWNQTRCFSKLIQTMEIAYESENIKQAINWRFTISWKKCSYYDMEHSYFKKKTCKIAYLHNLLYETKDETDLECRNFLCIVGIVLLWRWYSYKIDECYVQLPLNYIYASLCGRCLYNIYMCSSLIRTIVDNEGRMVYPKKAR